MAKLVLVRHSKSAWNELGKWTGWKDIPLTDEGKNDAKKTASDIKDIEFDFAYTSQLQRAKQTLEIILKETGQDELKIIEDQALNERNYGLFTGNNKWEVQKQVGEAEFHRIRRGWDHPIPDGETLEDVYNRVVPYYQIEILPKLKDGRNVIVAAHGNSLRALVKHLENLTVEQLMALEIGVGEAYVFEINNEGKVINKEIRAKNPEAGKL